jgi:hypothetical protein
VNHCGVPDLDARLALMFNLPGEAIAKRIG